jgi:hypothetical protein
MSWINFAYLSPLPVYRYVHFDRRTAGMAIEKEIKE